MAFTAKDVQALREKTGCGMMDCKKALVETNGDMDAAADYLREKVLLLRLRKQHVSQLKVLFALILRMVLALLLNLTVKQTSLLTVTASRLWHRKWQKLSQTRILLIWTLFSSVRKTV